MTEQIVAESCICVGQNCGRRVAFEELGIGLSGRVLYFGPAGVVKDTNGELIPASTESGLCSTCWDKVRPDWEEARRIAGEITPETEERE